jgi:hypothetical protein
MFCGCVVLIRWTLAIQKLFLIISILKVENAFSIPSFGLNLPPLGIDGKNFDYRETSPRFFAGEKASKSCATQILSYEELILLFRPVQTLYLDEGKYLLRR